MGQVEEEDTPGPTDSISESCKTLSITFNIWKLKFPPGKPPGFKSNNKAKHGKKGVRNMKIAKDLQPKWVNYAPCYPCCDDWVDFRKQVFIALEKVHHGVLPFLRAAYRDQTLLMEGWINGSEDYKKTDKALINDNAAFKEFAEVALAMPASVKMGLKLLQPKNPKDDKDANAHLFNYYTHESQIKSPNNFQLWHQFQSWGICDGDFSMKSVDHEIFKVSSVCTVSFSNLEVEQMTQSLKTITRIHKTYLLLLGLSSHQLW